MRVLNGTMMMELRKDGSLRVWTSDRVPNCPHRACRRARQCMRPNPVEGPANVYWLTCPLVPDLVHERLREGFEEVVFGPPSPSEKRLSAIYEKHRKADERARGLRR